MVRRFTKYPQNITAAVTTMAPEVTIGELLNLVYETQKLLGNYNSSDDGWFKLREVYLDACDSGDTDKIMFSCDIIDCPYSWRGIPDPNLYNRPGSARKKRRQIP